MSEGNALNMHGFIKGVMVVEIGDKLERRREVVGIRGYDKTDHIQTLYKGELSPWEFAYDFKRVWPNSVNYDGI